MNEAYKPRENDHLVEPMFEALREGVAPHEADDRVGAARVGGVRPFTVVMLGVVLLGLVLLGVFVAAAL